MTNVSVVLGCGFGDEGKGRVVSDLCHQYRGKDNLVVRFNGGPQAGHTVVHNGIRHVFSSFGSGTLQDVPTHISRFCYVDPISLINEYNVLTGLGIKPKLFIDPTAQIITPFDVISNRVSSVSGGLKHHDTCGAGIYKTFDRNRNGLKLHYLDLLNKNSLKAKMANIWNYYRNINTPGNIMDEFYDSVEKLISTPSLNYSVNALKDIDNIIFEGAQGILLDQDYGFFPYVTPSNTTIKNALTIMNEGQTFDRGPKRATNHYYGNSFDIYYVTRTYHTRHGSGYFPDNGRVELKNNENETNVWNEFQGEFKTTNLDITLFTQAIMFNEAELNRVPYKYERNIVLTCRDQNEIPFEKFKNTPLNLMVFGCIYYTDSPETSVLKILEK